MKKDLTLWSDEFKDFIRKNVPAGHTGGYIVIEDLSKNQSFHNVLYKFDELFKAC